jgi:site-specific DNA-methyltransferase (adenine-specific)/adenine-specific DNA-methyltransferase
MPSLNWIGKEAVVKHHRQVPYRLLEPDADLSCGDGKSGNLIVQGDNLHALKALLPRYAGKVKCIYIDPPYNTGNEGWVYNDNVNSPEIRRWLGEVVGKEGETLDRHDRWLCMMYPRLLLLREFLRDDGVIFVSINDEEIHNLRNLMDEIFGATKRMSSFVWRTDGNFDNQAKIKNCHEYILMYAKNPDSFLHPNVIDPSISESSKLNNPFIRNTIVKNGHKNPISNVTIPVGFPADFEKGVIKARENQYPHYDIDLVIEDYKLTHDVIAKTGWSSKSLLINFIENEFNPIIDNKGQKTRFTLISSGAIESIKERDKPSHVISVISGVGSTQSQSAELIKMGLRFPFPKPVELVKYLISMQNDKDSIVLDSFAGSGTTAHAVLNLNQQDGGNRQFILVEMDNAIAETVTAQRVRRVIEGYSNAKGETVEGLGGGFQFCRLSADPLFTATGDIRADVRFAQLAEFVWFKETGAGFTGLADSPLLGVFEGRAIYLLYNGILSDISPDGGNVLSPALFKLLPQHSGDKVIYAAAVKGGETWLQRERIVFKQTPYSLEV